MRVTLRYALAERLIHGRKKDKIMGVHRHPDGRYYVRHNKDGKDVKEYFGRGDVAKAMAHNFWDELEEKRGKLTTSDLTLGTLVQDYHRRHRVQESTQDSDFYRIDRIIVPQLGHHPAEGITSEILDSYVSARLKEGRSLETADRELDIVRAAYKWAQSQKPPIILKNPVADYRIKIPRKAKIAPVTEDEFARIMQHSPPHLIRGMNVQWYCGMRPGGELSRIRWSDVDFRNEEIRVESAHKGGPAERYVPIHEELLPLLHQWKEEDMAALGDSVDISGIAVVHYRFRAVKSVKTAWKTAKQRAGITRRLRMYEFRHAWYSNALRAGADIKALSEVGGHSRVDTPLIYYQHVTREQHREAVAKIPGVKIPARAPRPDKNKLLTPVRSGPLTSGSTPKQ